MNEDDPTSVKFSHKLIDMNPGKTALVLNVIYAGPASSINVLLVTVGTGVTGFLLIALGIALWTRAKRHRESGTNPPLNASNSRNESQSPRNSCLENYDDEREGRTECSVEDDIADTRLHHHQQPSQNDDDTSAVCKIDRQILEAPDPQPAVNPRPILNRPRSPKLVFKATMLVLTLFGFISIVLASSCFLDVRVTLVIGLPSTLQLEQVKLFCLEDHRNLLYLQAWKQHNNTNIQIFDLEQVLLAKQMCDAETVCRFAREEKGLMTCDPGSSSCVCQRGFKWKNNECVDFDECAFFDHLCVAGAVCINLNGSYTCICEEGFFLDGDTCKACSSSCPAGTYEVHPCSAHQDKVCMECKKCDRQEYETKPCQAGQRSFDRQSFDHPNHDHQGFDRQSHDRQCIHVAYPVLPANGKAQSTIVEGLRVETSENGFLESLHNTRHMETTYYVTDSKQMTDFFWFRESGIRINIGLQNINIVPVYEDVDHDSDNEFMMGQPNSAAEEKLLFADIVRHHCRNPMPNHYSLMLEVLKDRITAASQVKCTVDSFQRGACPAQVNIEEDFIRRTVNEPCKKLGSHPAPLNPAANSFVCTEPSNMLRELFNMTPSSVHHWAFPPRKCNLTAYSACAHCLQHDQCQVNDLFEQRCCQVDCYLSSCRQTSALSCSSSQVECASGDAYRFTLQPIFRNLRHQFQCHLRHRKPENLYQLWFYVSVNGTGFETPRIHREIYFDDVANLNNGRFQVEFLTIEHHTGMQLHNELILMGHQEGEHWNHTVYPVRSDRPRNKEKRFPVELYLPNIQLLLTQFEMPFDYSSSTWVDESGNCDKNTGKFVPVESSYGATSYGVHVVTKTQRQPYEYLLKSPDKPPHMKFIIPANSSVLRWWFKDGNASLITGDRLKTNLTLREDDCLWQVHVSGLMTACPGYLGVTINDKSELEEIARYDLLISCPPEFNVTFFIPAAGGSLEKSFDLVLDDAKREYHIYLTNIVIESGESGACHGLQQSHANARLASTDDACAHLLLFVAFAGVLSCVYLCFTPRYKQKAQKAQKGRRLSWRPHTSQKSQHETSPRTSNCARRFGHLNKSEKLLVVFCVLLQMCQCALLMFTTVSLVVFLYLQNQGTTTGRLDRLYSGLLDAADEMVQSVEEHVSSELDRQFSLLGKMENACSEHFDDLAKSVLSFIKNCAYQKYDTQLERNISFTAVEMYGLTVQHFKESMQLFLRNYRQNFDIKLRANLSSYANMIHRIVDSPWLMFVHSIFNQTLPSAVLHQAAGDVSYFSRHEVAFTMFLDLHYVEFVHLWSSRFWERLNYLLFPLLSSTRKKFPTSYGTPCATETLLTAFNNSMLNSRMNLTRYFVTDGSADRNPKWLSVLLSTRASQIEMSFANNLDFMPQSRDNTKAVNQDEVMMRDIFSTTKQDSSILQGLLPWSVLRAIFFTLDMIMIIFRLACVYLHLRNLCLGSKERYILDAYDRRAVEAPLLSSERASCRLRFFQNIPDESIDMQKQNSCDGVVFPPLDAGNHSCNTSTIPASLYGPQKDNTFDQTNLSTLFCNSNIEFETQSRFLRLKIIRECSDTSRDMQTTTKRCFRQMCSSGQITKIVFILVILVFVKLTEVFIIKNLSPDVLMNFSGFFSAMNVLHAESYDLNGYLRTVATVQANHLAGWLRKESEKDFSHLQAINEFFKREISSSRRDYHSEVCSMMKNSSLRESFCATSTVASSDMHHIPVVTCNFIPIGAKLFSVCLLETLRKRLKDDYEITVDSVVCLFSALSDFLLICVVIGLLLHCTGSIVHGVIRARHCFPQRVHYFVPCEQNESTPDNEKLVDVCNQTDIAPQTEPSPSPNSTPVCKVTWKSTTRLSSDFQASTSKADCLVVGFSETKV